MRDAWNIEQGYFNEGDPNQDGVCIYSIKYEDQTIKCRLV